MSNSKMRYYLSQYNSFNLCILLITLYLGKRKKTMVSLKENSIQKTQMAKKEKLLQ